MVMASARDLITIFVALELLSIPAYMLAGWRKRELTGNEAGMKYYLMGVFASAVMLYGMSLIYGVTGTTVLADDRRAAWTAASATTPVVTLGIVFVLVGFGFKVSAVPVPQLGARHLRGRAHPGHRVPLGGVEGGRLRGAHGAGLRRLLRPRRRVRPADVGAGRAHDDRRQPHRPAPDQHRAAVRLLVGRPGRLHPRPAGRGRQRPRASPRDAIQAVVSYLIIYTAMNLGAFAVIIAVARKTRSGEIDTCGGLFEYAPGLTVAMTVFLFALAGIPPLGGWFAKFQVFRAILSAGGAERATLLAVVVARQLGDRALLLRDVARVMLFEPPPDGDRTPVRVPSASRSRWASRWSPPWPSGSSPAWSATSATSPPTSPPPSAADRRRPPAGTR